MTYNLSIAIRTIVLAAMPAATFAATVSAPETVLTTFAQYTGDGPLTDGDSNAGASNTLFQSESLVSGFALPIGGFFFMEDLPNSLGTGFASAAGDSSGNFGVGTHGLFQQGPLPPHSMLASGTLTQELFNDTAEVVTFGAEFLIPAPVILFAGQVGNFFPAGADPAKDIVAEVLARIVTRVTRADGSTDEQVVFEYGMKSGRNAAGQMGVTTTLGAGPATVVEEFGLFSFTLPEKRLDFEDIAAVGPGDTIILDFQYFATGGTGFGETAVFAAIGDPFDLTSSGRFAFTQRGSIAPQPAPVPLPGALPLLVAGLLAMGGLRRPFRDLANRPG